MKIRKALESDIPQIIQLLKISLGESMIPKSEELWTWKHRNNPFGQSPVLVAEEDGQLIGVRAFLRWEYQIEGRSYKACRAVDTATHPDFQGKGIFKKLTLAMIEEIHKEGVDFIFNTPNSKSTPGYLKMGWEKWGKLPLKLNFFFNKSKKKELEQSDWIQISPLIASLENTTNGSTRMMTRLVPGYISWRYRDNPLFRYQYLSDGQNFLLIFRIKEGKMGREFRICDLFTAGVMTQKSKKELNQSLNQQIKASGSRFSSFSGLNSEGLKVLEMGVLPVLNIGPLVTSRKIQANVSPLEMNFGWSLGDLEVF